MNKLPIVAILFMILSCGPTGESTTEIKTLEEYLIHENRKELKELEKLASQLVSKGGVNLDRSKIEVLDSLHRTIKRQYNRDNQIENIAKIEEMLLSMEQEVKAEFSFASTFEKTQDIELPNPTTALMANMKHLTSLLRISLWSEYVYSLDQGLFSFSFSEENNEGNDSTTCYFGVLRRKTAKPQFSTRYSRMSIYEGSSIAQMRVANEDLNNSQIIIKMKMPSPIGEMIEEEITLGKKFQVNKIQQP